jgi:methanethiol S-methyltransferase
MKRYLVLGFGIASYLLFLAVAAYACGFIGGFGVPTRLDGPADTPLVAALAIDLLLLTLFAAQHSVMARPAFKRRWTLLVPQPLERSIYVLCTNLALVLLFWQWRPIPGVLWDIRSFWGRGVLLGLYAGGWLTVLAVTCLINHFDLFGLRQVWLYFRNRPYTPIAFAAPGPYKLVRHPMYVGWLLTFWATPTMTTSHLLFALVTTAYILLAIRLEEQDLARFLGDEYTDYQREVPMLIPAVRRRVRVSAQAPACDVPVAR